MIGGIGLMPSRSPLLSIFSRPAGLTARYWVEAYAIVTHNTYFPQVLGYDVTNSSLLIESPGVLKAAIATSIMVNMTCKPLPGTTSNSGAVFD